MPLCDASSFLKRENGVNKTFFVINIVSNMAAVQDLIFKEVIGTRTKKKPSEKRWKFSCMSKST